MGYGINSRVPRGTLIDPEFDDLDLSPQDREDLKFIDDPACRMGDLAGGLSSIASSRRRRKTTRTDEPETVELTDEEPPGWAEP